MQVDFPVIFLQAGISVMNFLLGTIHILRNHIFRIFGDLRHARIFFTALGGVTLVPVKDLKDALTRHKTVLQAALGRQLTMKFTPKLTFVPDDAFDKADHMNRLIHGLPQSN